MGHPALSRPGGLRFMVSHPSRKDKDAAWMGHPGFWDGLIGTTDESEGYAVRVRVQTAASKVRERA